MKSGELLEMFRDEMDDRVEPYLWGDDLVYRYFDDAETMFCRLTDGIADATTAAVAEIAVVPDTEWYPLHESVRKLRQASRGDTGAPLRILNQEDMPTLGIRFDGRKGPLEALILGIEEGKVRMWPVPTETFTVRLSTFRLPLVRITDDQDFEIPALHHQHLLMWAKHRAYLKQTAETLDKTRAAELGAAFRSYCEQVQREQELARRKPRTVAYGGL